MKKKSDKAKIKAKLEKVVKEYVKIRDKFTCQKCGKKVSGTNCHASHVIPVSRDGRLAYDSINLKVLCYHDHINWWHKFPTESGKWFEEKFPKRLKYLNQKYEQHQKEGAITLQWYEEQLMIITKALNKLK